MLSHHPSKFGGLGLCGSRYITILVVEDKIPHACLNPSLLLTSKVHGMKYMSYHVQYWSDASRATINEI